MTLVSAEPFCFDAAPSLSPAGRLTKRKTRESGRSLFDRLGDLGGMSLRDVCNDTKTRGFCGPTAVAAITGQPISVVRDAFRQARFGQNWIYRWRTPAIMGTSQSEVRTVLRFFGYEGHWHTICDRPTFAYFLDTRTGPMRTHPCIVQVSNHWVAISGWQFCDTFTKGKVVEADDAPWRRARVHRVFVASHRVSTTTPIVRKTRQR